MPRRNTLASARERQPVLVRLSRGAGGGAAGGEGGLKGAAGPGPARVSLAIFAWCAARAAKAMLRWSFPDSTGRAVVLPNFPGPVFFLRVAFGSMTARGASIHGIGPQLARSEQSPARRCASFVRNRTRCAIGIQQDIGKSAVFHPFFRPRTPIYHQHLLPLSPSTNL